MSSPSRGSSHLSLALLNSLSVVREYLALRMVPVDSVEVSRASTYSGILLEVISFSLTGLFTLCGRPFHTVLLTNHLVTPVKDPTTPRRKPSWFGLIPLRSPLLRNRFFFLFRRLLRCFSSPGLPRKPMNSVFVNSSIPDRHLFVSSPRLFADFHALHRLLTPRHPHTPLLNLTTVISNSLDYPSVSPDSLPILRSLRFISAYSFFTEDRPTKESTH